MTHAQSPNSLPCWEDADGRPRWARHWHWQGSRAWRWCYSRSPGQPCNQPSDLPLDLGALKLQKSERRKLQMSLLQAVFPTLSSLLLFFRSILCWAELHAPTLSWLVCVREGGLFNTSRHRGPSMSTETVYLYRLYQSYITIWSGEAIWKHKKPPRLISSLGDHFSREVCHCLLISTWKLVSLFNLETRRRMDQENTYMQRVI